MVGAPSFGAPPVSTDSGQGYGFEGHELAAVLAVGRGHGLSDLGPGHLELDLQAFDLGLQLEHPPHTFEIEAGCGQVLDAAQPRHVLVTETPAAAGGAAGVEKSFALVDAQRLRVHADKLGRHRDHVHRPALTFLGCHDAPASETARSGGSSTSVSRSMAARCSFANLAGTATSTVTSRSPWLCFLSPGTPRPFTRKVRPDGVPAGTLRVTGSPKVGTVRVVPRAASAKETGSVSVRLRPRRPKVSWPSTRTTT